MTALEIALAGYLAFGQPTGNYYEAITKHSGLQVIHDDGAVTLRLEETGREETAEGGSKTVTIRMKDEHYPFEVTRYVRTWDDCAAVETWAEIRHEEAGAVRLVRADSFAAPVAVKSETVRVMSLTGIAKNEASVSKTALANGQTLELVSSAGTRNAWEANAAMMVEFGDGVDEECGKVLGVALEWAGTNCRRVRRNWNGNITEVFAGIDMTTGPYTLDPGVTFTTPRAILVWSERGRGEVSREFHRWAHRHLMPHGYDLHPVLLNSWEGSYFSFTEQTLLDMMDGVKEMGGEMFVLDDGWFGCGKHARDEVNKATAGLGDWCVNVAKLPHGLGWLADEAAKRGLQFGLWIEPEMANTNSWLYQEHPDWVLQEAGRPLVCGRGKTQVTLDFCNPAVRDNLFGQLDAVYDAIPSLAYVKWDCNANIWNPGSPYLAADRQPNLWYDYTIGYNELMARFQQKRPQIMVQACASGGGRMDFGSLRYADEFWASDCTDPYRRIFIQWGCSQFYPASAMACHVTASPNHQTKRVTPLKYRFDVAMTGRLGFELHPKDMTADEIAFAKAAVADYKRIRPVVQRGDLYRLVSPYEKPLSALMYVGEGRDAAVVFALGLKDFGKHTETLKLRGLDPEATYSIKEINCGERLHLEGGSQSSATVSGRDLMERGLAVMLSGDYDSAVFEISRQEAVAGLAVGCCSIVKPGYDTLIAHRGESVDAPENTLPAYKTAVERGFGFECDIYLSKDGRVFTFHDRNLTRTTGGANTNNCTDVTWDVVSRLDVGNWGKFKGSKFAGTRPALLEEVLKLTCDGRWLYIDVKSKDAKIVPYVKEIFARQKKATPANTLFLCGSVACGKEFKRLMPEFKVLSCLNCRNGWKKDSKPVAVSEIISTTREMGADGVDIRYDREVTTAEYIRTIKDEGLELHVWTVDDLADTLEAFRRGAQTVTTNCAKKQLDEYRKAAALVATSSFGNPIFGGWYADPQIRRYGDTYWVFPTRSDRFAAQTAFDAFSSRDMKTWTKHPRILTTNEVTWAKGAMWAPDAHEIGGKYYLFFSANDAYPASGKREDGEPQTEAKLHGYGGIGVAVADRPEGPYRDLIGKPLIDRFWNCAQPIDQYVFEYKGDWYMVYGGWRRCNLVKLAKDFKSLVPFEDGAMWRDMTPKGYVEGSVMFERKGRWYFMYSGGSWTRDTYCVNYSVGDSPFGPFEFKGKVLGVQRPLATGAGHHSVVCKPGTDEWYICYHRRPIPSKGRDHRVVCIDRMEFDANGDIKPIVMTK